MKKIAGFIRKLKSNEVRVQKQQVEIEFLSFQDIVAGNKLLYGNKTFPELIYPAQDIGSVFTDAKKFN